MSLVGALERIEQKVENALDGYSEALMAQERARAPRMFGVMESSIQIENMGKLHNRVGIDMGILMGIQINVYPIDYASLYIGGHRTSPWVPFTDGTWRKFPGTGGTPFISDAFEAMPSFKSFY